MRGFINRRLLLTLLAVSACGGAHAQDFQFGVSVALFSNVFFNTFLIPAVHVSGEFAPDLRLRGMLESILIVNHLQGDVLRVRPLAVPNRSAYMGGGLDLFVPTVSASLPTRASVGIHLTAGLEFRSGNRSTFLELQPTYELGGVFVLGLRAGRNFHF